MTFDEWIKGEMGRGLSRLEVDQMRAAWNAALAAERAVSDKLLEAVHNLLRVKGRHHTEQAYERLEVVAFEVEAMRKEKK